MRTDLLLAAQILCGYHTEMPEEERYAIGDRLFRHLERLQKDDDGEQ